MKTKLVLISFLAVVTVLNLTAYGQFKEMGVDVGLAAGGAFGINESDERPLNPQGRLSLGIPLTNCLQLEIGSGYAIDEGEGYQTFLMPADARLKFSPFFSRGFIPYIYAGAGILSYDIDPDMPEAYPEVDRTGLTGVVPFGVGFQQRISDIFSIYASGGANYIFSDDINPEPDDTDDMFAGFLGGLRFATGSGDTDRDNDGLVKSIERQLGTDPKNPDTDMDGLSDGEEHSQYNTHPLRMDSDSDGLNDGEEVHTYGTDPNLADTDSDGLNDNSELNVNNTDPLIADTDNDGLSDGSEVNVHNTNPLVSDTDGDGLNDGVEVNDYGTNPLLADTDGGTVNDAVEVDRGTNPLDAMDDVPKKEVLQIEEKKIVLEGVTFNSGSSEILAESEGILTLAYNTLEANPELIVEIHGYTDNTGSESYNLKLSQLRAESVKNWLVSMGIDAIRLTAKGFGPGNPIASNDTREGRKKNRRIEFVIVE